MISGISPMFSSTGHNIELLLQIELPLVASAFKMSGYTAAQVRCLFPFSSLIFVKSEAVINFKVDKIETTA